MSTQNRFDLVSQELPTSFETAYAFISAPENLSKWALAFIHADDASARIRLPDGGEADIKFTTKASKESGTIDWYMDMPDGSVMRVLSRLIELPNDKVVYTFMFFAGGVVAEDVNSFLTELKKLVEQEFENLQRILSA